MRPILIALGLIALAQTAISQPTTSTTSDSTTSLSSPKDSAATTMTTTRSRKEKDKWAKSLQPETGKALVYIMRPSSMGALIHMTVRCDSVPIGKTGAGTYVYAMLEPGKHKLSSHAENWATLDIEVEAGKIYYIRQRSEMGGLYAETDLEILDEQNGLKYLKKCEIAKDNAATNDPAKK